MQSHKSKMFLPFFTWQHGMVRKSSWRCKSDFRHFGLTKGLHVTKTVMRQELLVESTWAKKLALWFSFKHVINEGGKTKSMGSFLKKLNLIEILAPRLLPKNSCKFATQHLKYILVWFENLLFHGGAFLSTSSVFGANVCATKDFQNSWITRE